MTIDGGSLEDNFLVTGGVVYKAVMFDDEGVTDGVQIQLETLQDVPIPLLFTAEAAAELVRQVRITLGQLPDDGKALSTSDVDD